MFNRILKRQYFRYFLPLALSLFLLADAYPQSPPGPVPPNVILITVDTLRADRLGCYGYKQIDTSNMDRMAAKGARFSTVVAQSPLTLPSHCTILTGTYPFFHQVRDNVGYRLDSSATTLAEILKPRGFQTGAFVGSYVLDSKFGLNQGFDYYFDDFHPGKNPDGFVNLYDLERRGGVVIDHTLSWLEKALLKPPFFAWIHLYDPHDPYDPPQPFKVKYKARPYDGEIAYVDSQIGRLLDFLINKKLYEKTIIVLTGDHGESFGEHNEVKHGYFLYDTTLLVPLIIKPSNRFSFKDPVVNAQVRLVDIAPTILQMLDLPKSPDFQGTGLLGLLLGKQKELRLDAYSETYYPLQFGSSNLFSLRQTGAKYIQAPRPEYYNLAQDPAELKNLYPQNLTFAGELKRRLDGTISTFSSKVSARKAQSDLPAEEMAKLAALGYVGGVVRPANSTALPASSLPDPKDRLEIFRLLNAAGLNAATGRCSEAEPQLQKAIQQAPGVTTAYFLLGRCYFNERKFDQAYPVFQQLYKLAPESAEAQFYTAACEFYLNRLDAAEAGFQKVLALNPRYSYAYKYMGLISLAKGNPQKALGEFQRVVELLPGDEESHWRLGFIFARQSRFEEAIAQFKTVLQINPLNALAHKNLGAAYQRTNQPELARQEFSEACRLDSKLCNF
jgi:arylsulfatase A-like enzyme/Tfp pilus assembly protein PilF